jgi:hypothetical protein
MRSTALRLSTTLASLTRADKQCFQNKEVFMHTFKKHHFMVIIILVIALGVIGVIGTSAFQEAQSANQASGKTQHIVTLDGSLAHTYKSLGELKGDSTLIVVGTVSNQQTAVGNHGIPYTNSTFLIERTVMSKSSPSQTILVRQMGGVTSDGTQWVVEGFPLLQTGSRYVLFLTPALSPGEFYTVGAPQGVFTVSAGDTVSSFTNIGVSVKDLPTDTFIQQIQSALATPTHPLT